VKRTAWIVAAVAIGRATAAHAECPTAPDDATCRPWSALLVPTAIGVVYTPADASGPYFGGGVELSYTWSDNSQAFGPSQGRVRLDVAGLGGTAMDASAMVMYRGGAQVSFERNASRTWLIPHFDADLGGISSRTLGQHAFADAGLGVYLVHRRGVVVDLEIVGVLPFADVGKLGGARTSLAASFSLW
jgi:hypothetical protein